MTKMVSEAATMTELVERSESWAPPLLFWREEVRVLVKGEVEAILGVGMTSTSLMGGGARSPRSPEAMMLRGAGGGSWASRKARGEGRRMRDRVLLGSPTTS